MNIPEPNKRNYSSWVLLGFLLFFGLLFLQFPLNGYFPGNIDVWYNLAIFNDYYNHLFNSNCGEAMYPVGHLFKFGETAYASGSIFILIKCLGLADLWAYYLLITLSYALTGWSTFLLSRSWGASLRSALFAGIAFSTCNFLIGNIEGINNIFFFPGLLSMYYYRRFSFNFETRYLLLASFFGVLQLYGSSYLFLITLLVLSAFHLQSLLLSKEKLKLLQKSIAPLAMAILLMLPYIYTYSSNNTLSSSENRFTVFDSPHGSLQLTDLLRTLPGNLIYPEVAYEPNEPAISNIHSAFPGFALLFLAALALSKNFRKWRLLAGLGLLGLLLAFGPIIYVSANGSHFTSPLYLFFKATNSMVLRIPIRAYLLFILAISLMAAGGIDALVKPGKKGYLISLLLLTILLLENLSFQLPKHASTQIGSPATGYYETLQSQTSAGQVLLNLPVGTTGTGITDDFNKRMAAEYIYYYWQTQHCLNMLNGLSGFTPQERVKLAEYADNINSHMAITKLNDNIEFDYLALHAQFMAPGAFEKQSYWFKSHTQYQVLLSTDSLLILKRVRP